MAAEASAAVASVEAAMRQAEGQAPSRGAGRLLRFTALLGLAGLVLAACTAPAFVAAPAGAGSAEALQHRSAWEQPGALVASSAIGLTSARAPQSWIQARGFASSAAVLALLGIAAVASRSPRDESRTTAFGKHDRRTFRGKQHAHSFGRHRLRKTKARRLSKILAGTFDPEAVVQRGQPEPEHVWDAPNILTNRWFFIPQYGRDAFADCYESYLESERSIWQKKMGVYGKQDAYINWTPPGTQESLPEPPVEPVAPVAEDDTPDAPPDEVAAALVGQKVDAKMVKELRERSMAGILDCQKALKETEGDMDKAMDWLKKKGVAKADKKAANAASEGNISSYVHFNSKIGVIVEVNSQTDFVAINSIFKEFTADVAMQIAANPAVTMITADDVSEEVREKEKALEMAKEDLAGKPDNIKEKIVEGRLKKKFEEVALMGQKWLKDEDKTVQEVLKERIAKLGENLVIRRFERLTLGEGLVKKEVDFAGDVNKELEKYKDAPPPPPAEEKPKVEEKVEAKKEEGPKISAADVKTLRQRSGAGILDAKKALAETGSDMDKAMEWLKKKGMAKADKKAGNEVVEGAVASYVHFNNKLGVLCEVNCQTDFVAINAIFKEFASDVAMQIAANPTVVCVTADELPEDMKAKAKALEMEKEDLEGKPDAVKEKIVEGRLRKKFDEMCLMGQKWLKDEDKTVQEVLKEKIAKLGENMVIRRFVRLNLGEGLEKEEADFAAGVEAELSKYR
mmetsp:Transcript_119630/g.267253  ORF Transcript_119630/g.267253 Transcript_119630/m.267253 type:complete len:740 (-) Transcript_119630:73-2292(-)